MTDIFENGLRKSNMIDDYIKNAKKNLRRRLKETSQMSMLDASFMSILIRSKKADIITIYLENHFELDNLKVKSNSDKYIVSTAFMMREKI